MKLIDVDVFRTEHKLAEQCEDCKRNDKWHCDEQMYSARDICGWLDDAPTIDAVPERHGHIEIKVINPYDGEDCYCSECGHWSLLPDYKWCPYCGARLDGDLNDG